MSLAEKVALVTGAGSGIGRAISLALAQQGAAVVLSDIDLPRAEAVAREVGALGRQALSLKADVAKGDEVAAMVKAAVRKLGKVDILVNNAGIDSVIPFPQMSFADWDHMLAVHVHGSFHCAREVIQGMIDRHWGRIINMSSIAGLMGQGRSVHYSTAKAALLGFTKALAREVAEYGITVNAIAPGLIDTPMARVFSPHFVEAVMRVTPLRRMGRPEEIAYAAAFLASDEASYITGQVISPNGGNYM